MHVNTLTLESPEYPAPLRQLAHPPRQLYVRGDLAGIMARPRLAVVGSRDISRYGREATTKLVEQLVEQGIVIVSGLALGVDGVAHRAALQAGGLTLAVLPGAVEKPYPAAHRQLAEQILDHGGALVSEYPDRAANAQTFRSNFVARNRIIAGLSDAVLITEAAKKSGSLHTARFALEIGRDVMAVPGSIFSPTSVGAHNLIKSGAAPVTSALDVLEQLGLHPVTARPAVLPRGSNPEEQNIIDLIASGMQDAAELLPTSRLEIPAFNHTLTMLELSGKIRALGANHWCLR